jgi:hypothetical protein
MLDFSELCAANEDDYRYQRYRTSPISSTIYSIPNYPKKLRIYLTNASPYWQVCCFFKGKTYKRSLKTTIRQVAIRAAKDFFHQSVADLYGTTINIREDRALLFSDLVRYSNRKSNLAMLNPCLRRLQCQVVVLVLQLEKISQNEFFTIPTQLPIFSANLIHLRLIQRSRN